MTTGGVTAVPPAARIYQGRRAGLVSRSIANTLDAVVVIALLIGALAGLNGLKFLADPRGFKFVDPSFLLSLTAGFCLSFMYLSLAWATTGQTYGDHVMGLRVVTRSGGRVHLLAALARAALCVVFPIGLVLCGSRSRRSVADVTFGTNVVYDWRPSVVFRQVQGSGGRADNRQGGETGE